MARRYLADLKEGDRFSDVFVVRRRQLLEYRERPGRYLLLVLADRTGERVAKAWDHAEKFYELAAEGTPVRVTGVVERYQDELQIIVQRLRPAREQEFAPGDFLPTSEADREALWARVRAAIDAVQTPPLRRLLEAFWEDEALRERIEWAPATRAYHHAYLGGLLEHLVEMLTLAEPLPALFPDLDPDLLTAGILLHDLGVLEALEDPRRRWTLEYTDEGRLLGHTTLGLRALEALLERVPDVPEELALRLRHMILSHHGQREWGAPVEPRTLEAAALHGLNELSRNLAHLQEVVRRGEPAEGWTAYDPLSRRTFFVGEG